jgi:uncharacterized protein DUF1707
MIGPGEWTASGHGRLRAAHADRDRVVATLKAAFVQGRLDQDELDARVGRALVSRTYAELGALTADLPADLPSGPADLLVWRTDVPARSAAAGTAAAEPSHTPAQTMAKAAYRSAICLFLSVALVEATFLTRFGGYMALGIWMFVMFVTFLGYGVVDTWNEWRAGRQPPRAGQRSPDGRDGPGLEGHKPGRTGLGPSGVHGDPNRAELRVHLRWPDRRGLGGQLSCPQAIS